MFQFKFGGMSLLAEQGGLDFARVLNALYLRHE